MALYFYHSFQLWGTACEARDRALAVIAQDASALPNDAMVAIILSAASAEGFINELGEFCHPAFTGAPALSVPSNVSAFAEAMREIENNRGSTLLKFLVASQILTGTMFDKGANPYQDLSILFDLRDMIMHLKLRDQLDPNDDGMHSVVLPTKKLQTLCTRGLVRPITKDMGMSWLNAMHTGSMAKWACRTSLNMMDAVMDMVPAAPALLFDGWRSFLKEAQQKEAKGGH